jgi:hypothetical protein
MMRNKGISGSSSDVRPKSGSSPFPPKGYWTSCREPNPTATLAR